MKNKTDFLKSHNLDAGFNGINHVIISRDEYNKIIRYFNNKEKRFHDLIVNYGFELSWNESLNKKTKEILFGINFFHQHITLQKIHNIGNDCVIVDLPDYEFVKNYLEKNPKIIYEIMFNNCIKEKYQNPSIFIRFIWLFQFKKVATDYSGRCIGCDAGNDNIECIQFKCPCSSNEQLKRIRIFKFLYKS